MVEGLSLAMASRMPLEQRWPIIGKLVLHGEDAKDQNLPLMYWYATEALVPADVKRAVALAGQSKIPMVREYIQRSYTLGNASDDAIAFAENMNWELG